MQNRFPILRILLPRFDATVNHEVMLVGDPVDADRTEGQMLEAHGRCVKPPPPRRRRSGARPAPAEQGLHFGDLLVNLLLWVLPSLQSRL